MNAFFNAQFSYCPLTWMFHSRKLNNRINKLHEGCLRIVYNNNTSTYEELLKTDNSVSVHFRNVQALAIELYKVVNGFSPDIIKDVFPLSENLCYNTRNKRTFRSRNIRTVHFGSETLSHLAPKIWELVPGASPLYHLIDSLLNGIEESKLSKSRHIRVQPISGGKIEDIRSNLNDLLHADLQNIILHIGTNNAVTETLTEIFNKLLSLKEEIVEKLPSCNIIISNPTKRTDDVTAHKTNEEVIRLIKSTDINFIDNGNIKEKHLGKRGLHLIARGNSMLAGNLLNAIRK